MNCAWCGANADGSDSHGICDSCMQRFFGVNPEEIHAEMQTETEAEDQTPDTADEFNSWRPQR